MKWLDELREICEHSPWKNSPESEEVFNTQLHSRQELNQLLSGAFNLTKEIEPQFNRLTRTIRAVKENLLSAFSSALELKKCIVEK